MRCLFSAPWRADAPPELAAFKRRARAGLHRCNGHVKTLTPMLESSLRECGAFLLHHATFDWCSRHFCPPVNRRVAARSRGAFGLRPSVSLEDLHPLVVVHLHLVPPGVSGLAPHLWPVQKTSSWGEKGLAGPEEKPERDSRGHGYSWRDLVQRICNLHFKHTLKSVPGCNP